MVIGEGICFAQRSFTVRLGGGEDAFLLLLVLTLEAETEGGVLFFCLKLLLRLPLLLHQFLKCMWTEAWRGPWLFVGLVLTHTFSKQLCCRLTESRGFVQMNEKKKCALINFCWGLVIGYKSEFHHVDQQSSANSSL